MAIEEHCPRLTCNLYTSIHSQKYTNTQTQTDRQTDRQTDTHTQRERERERERKRERETEIHTNTITNTKHKSQAAASSVSIPQYIQVYRPYDAAVRLLLGRDKPSGTSRTLARPP